MNDEPEPAARHSPDRLLGWSVAVVAALFVAGLAAVSAVAPDPTEGPTPGSTRLAYYGLFAARVVGWRLVLATGVVVSVAVLGLGVRTWARPPHNLRECFADYRENGTRQGTVCESGRLNRPLGTRRLNEGIAGAIAVMGLTAVAVAQMLPRPVTP